MAARSLLDKPGNTDDEGFLTELIHWSRDLAVELADRNDIGPLSEAHWKIIEYVRDYYGKNGEGPPIMQIGRITGMSSKEICRLFPCGVVKGAFRLAGLPKPEGCI